MMSQNKAAAVGCPTDRQTGTKQDSIPQDAAICSTIHRMTDRYDDDDDDDSGGGGGDGDGTAVVFLSRLSRTDSEKVLLYTTRVSSSISLDHSVDDGASAASRRVNGNFPLAA